MIVIGIVAVIIIGISTFVSQNTSNFSEITPRIQPDDRNQEISSNNDQPTKAVVQKQQDESQTTIYNNSFWPCILNSDSSGKIDVDCYTNGLHHFYNPSISSVSIDQVRLSWNAAGNYHASEQYFSDTKIYDLGRLVSKESSSTPTGSLQSKPHDELIRYALKRINEDREKNGLQPVLLSNNKAAQVHADDVFTKKSISHWMSNGEKPYMTYTRYGGIGSVSQNVATFECIGIGCNLDPIKQIGDSEHDMMYDDALSNWGHRDNIMHPYHTHVSIGITYNDRFFVMVQNFEDNYLLSENPISVTNGRVQINGILKSGEISNISIFYDPLPSISLFEQHRYDGYYMLGNSIAVIAPPLGPNEYYEEPSDYKLIIAKTMSVNGNSVHIDFDMSDILTEPGVYTIGVWVQDNGNDFLITNYSIMNR